MLDIRKKKVKAIYFNAFHCPECGLELHMDNIVLTTCPAQYCYYCDCGFRTTSFQKPGIAKISQLVLQPQHLSTTTCCSNIFCLSG